MTGREIINQVRTEKRADQHFIKWWRKENDFLDYELVDNFFRDARPDDEFSGYELLTTEQMWEALREFDPSAVSRGEREGQEVIFWEQKLSDGSTKSRICPYTPDSLISVFDAMTRGNPVD